MQEGLWHGLVPRKKRSEVRRVDSHRVHHKTLQVTLLINKFLDSYGTRKFITMFTNRPRHWSACWGRCPNLWFILILSFHIDGSQAIGSRQVFRLIYISVFIFNTFLATRALFYFTIIAGHSVGCLITHTAAAAWPAHMCVGTAAGHWTNKIMITHYQQDRQCTFNVKHCGAFAYALLQWKSNKYYIWVCVCSLSYPACNAHAPYCHLWPAPLYNISPHYLIDGTKLKKKILNTKKPVCLKHFSY